MRPLPPDLVSYLKTRAQILIGSYKLHATSRQLHNWTRGEKTRLKKARSEANVAAAAAARAYDDEKTREAPNCAEMPSSPDAESSFDGEMDNFQTPLVRSVVSFFVTYMKK